MIDDIQIVVVQKQKERKRYRTNYYQNKKEIKMASLVTNDTTTTTTTTTTRRRTTAATETSEQMTDSEIQHFEDLPGILQICIGTATKPGLIAYFDDDILAMINMFAKTCKKFLEYDPLRCYYFSCLLYTSPSPRDGLLSRMPSSA